jgi:hypothetical protein
VHALEWLLDTLCEDGDEVVVLRVVEPGTSAHTVLKSDVDEAREEAQALMDSVMEKNVGDRSVRLAFLLSVGHVTTS